MSQRRPRGSSLLGQMMEEWLGRAYPGLRRTAPRMLRPFILVWATLYTGCAFVAIESNATRRIDNPQFTTERAKLNCDDLDKPSANTRPPSAVTKQQLQAAWGSPDEIEIANDAERWTYKSGLRWNGLWGLILVVPVPLLVPTGHKEMIVEFSADRVQTVEARYQVDREFGCGFVPIHGGGWYCSPGELNHYYGLRSAFCGYGQRLDDDKRLNERRTEQ